MYKVRYRNEVPSDEIIIEKIKWENFGEEIKVDQKAYSKEHVKELFVKLDPEDEI